MLRAALFIIVVATMLGALMPAGPVIRSPADDVGPVASADVRAPDPAPPVDSVSDPTSVAEPAPFGPSPEGSVTLERAEDGHFYAEAKVNGAPVRFLVDTGASGVALAQDDARRAGIAVADSSFEVIGQGASGEVRGQAVSLERISLGHKESEGLPAVILEGSQQSLLGQNFLRTFESVSIEGDRMVMR